MSKPIIDWESQSLTSGTSNLNYQGVYNANTNTPPLANGVGTSGDFYHVTVGGSNNPTGVLIDEGHAIAYNGSTWEDGGAISNTDALTLPTTYAPAAGTVAAGDVLTTVISKLDGNIATKQPLITGGSDGNIVTRNAIGQVIDSGVKVVTAIGADDTTIPTSKAIVTAITNGLSGISGDATISNIGVLTISNNSISNAKMEAMPTQTIKGNITGVSSNPTDVTLSQLFTSMGLQNVARTASYNDLNNKPTIPAAQVQTDWNVTVGMGAILNKPILSTVATSGSYNDLSNKPVIVSPVNSDWNAVTGLAQILNRPTLALVATSGSYNDLSNKPIINGQVQVDWNATSGLGSILNKPVLSTVATSGLYADLNNKPVFATVALSGNYNDLLNKPVLNTPVNSDWNATSGLAQILNKPTLSTVATSGNYNDLSNKPTLSTVATSGNYNDLSNKPTIPAAQVQTNWTSTSGISSILNKPTLSTVATSGSYNDLSNKPATLTGSTLLAKDVANSGTTDTVAVNTVISNVFSLINGASVRFGQTICVDSVLGSDTTGNGSLSKPVATISKAITLSTLAPINPSFATLILVTPTTYNESFTLPNNVYLSSLAAPYSNTFIINGVVTTTGTSNNGISGATINNNINGNSCISSNSSGVLQLISVYLNHTATSGACIIHSGTGSVYTSLGKFYSTQIGSVVINSTASIYNGGTLIEHSNPDGTAIGLSGSARYEQMNGTIKGQLVSKNNSVFAIRDLIHTTNTIPLVNHLSTASELSSCDDVMVSRATTSQKLVIGTGAFICSDFRSDLGNVLNVGGRLLLDSSLNSNKGAMIRATGSIAFDSQSMPTNNYYIFGQVGVESYRLKFTNSAGSSNPDQNGQLSTGQRVEISPTISTGFNFIWNGGAPGARVAVTFEGIQEFNSTTTVRATITFPVSSYMGVAIFDYAATPNVFPIYTLRQALFDTGVTGINCGGDITGAYIVRLVPSTGTTRFSFILVDSNTSPATTGVNAQSLSGKTLRLNFSFTNNFNPI